MSKLTLLVMSTMATAVSGDTPDWCSSDGINAPATHDCNSVVAEHGCDAMYVDICAGAPNSVILPGNPARVHNSCPDHCTAGAPTAGSAPATAPTAANGPPACIAHCWTGLSDDCPQDCQFSCGAEQQLFQMWLDAGCPDVAPAASPTVGAPTAGKCAPLVCGTTDGSLPCGHDVLWAAECYDVHGIEVGNTNGGGIGVPTGITGAACTSTAGYTLKQYSCQDAADYIVTLPDDGSFDCELARQQYVDAGCCDPGRCTSDTPDWCSNAALFDCPSLVERYGCNTPFGEPCAGAHTPISPDHVKLSEICHAQCAIPPSPPAPPHPPPPSAPPPRPPPLPPAAPLAPGEVAVSTYVELRDLLLASRGSGAEVRVSILPPGTKMELEEELTIDGFNLTLRARHATFSAQERSRAFRVAPAQWESYDPVWRGGASRLELRDATIKDGYVAGSGSAIAAGSLQGNSQHASAHLVLDGVRFIDCATSSEFGYFQGGGEHDLPEPQPGGACYVGGASVASLRRCAFEKCTFDKFGELGYGQVTVSTAGVLLRGVASAELDECTFNACEGAGIAAWGSGHLSMLRCWVRGCRADARRAFASPIFVYSVGSLLALDCTVENCVGAAAGAVAAWAADARFEGCTFRDCGAMRDSKIGSRAGDLSAYHMSGAPQGVAVQAITLAMLDCLFERCSYTRELGERTPDSNGAIVAERMDLHASAIVSNVTIRECHSAQNAGLSLHFPVSLIEGCTFEDNRCWYGSTAITCESGDGNTWNFTLRDLYISNCSAAREAMTPAQEQEVALSSATVSLGGANIVRGYRITVIGCDVSFGGFTQMSSASGPVDAVFDEVRVENCTAHIGAGIHLHLVMGSVTVMRSVLRDLKTLPLAAGTSDLGGGVFVSAPAGLQLTLNDVLFERCAAKQGGAMQVIPGSAIIVLMDVVMRACVATWSGAALDVPSDAEVTYTGNRSVVEDCVCDSSICVGVLTFGRGPSGAASRATLDGISMRGCRSGYRGGVLVRQGASATLRGCEFSACIAQEGGALSINDGSLDVIDSRIYGCTGPLAYSRGGAAYVEAGDLYLAATIIEGCSAVYGGGVAVGPDGLAVLADCVERDPNPQSPAPAEQKLRNSVQVW